MTKKISENNDTFAAFINNFMSSLFIVMGLYYIFIINFTALSISLHRNYNEHIGKKVSSAVFAFLFGIIYLLFNYYFKSILKDKKAINVASSEDFKLFPF
jgi:glucan phosphoethanolaminetransferase (alkaline phosphatase superfamily)